jgi:hypothetical protein
LSSELIDREIIVFDGGNPHTPPIKPPNGVNWQSLSVRLLHIQDNIQPNIGLTAPRMGYDISPFIQLPRQMSLDIIGEIWVYSKLLTHFLPAKLYGRRRCVVVIINVSSLTTESLSDTLV